MKIKYLPFAIICFIACSSTKSQEPATPKTADNIVTTIVASVPVTKVPINPVVNVPNSVCPEDMKHISGTFCTDVVQKCIKYLDPPTSRFARCAEFAPTVCTGKHVIKNFCIDTEEHHPSGNNMPSTDVTWNQASQECAQEGKYLCTENQWTLACEGNEIFPHTTGYKRPSDKCNFDRTKLLGSGGEFINQSQPITDNLECISPFGVHNMNGNVDEWVVLEHPYVPKSGPRMMSGLKGGWWGGMRDRCRPVTVGHNEVFHELQVGFRCCKEVQ